MAKNINDTITLANGLKIPQLGFGVYKSPEDLCVQSILTAFKVGYRHVDTAQFYANEAQVGEAVKQSGLPRKDIYLTTKILRPTNSEDGNYKKCAESVEKMDLISGKDDAHVDLLLVHTSNKTAQQRKEMWLALERLHKEGKAKSIGVSNYGIGHIEEMKEYATVWPPHVNQIELHPWAQQGDIVKYCETNNIAVQAYCPIVRNQRAGDPTVAKIAQKHSVTENQVLIRYSLERNWIPLPKSDNPDRIKMNAEIYGFKLDDEDMAALNGLDQGPSGAICQWVDNTSTK